MRLPRILTIAAIVIAATPALPAMASEHEETPEPDPPPPEHVLTIRTEPPVAGMVVDVGGTEYESDSAGVIRVRLEEGAHLIEPQAVVAVDDTTRYLYRRWNDSFERVRDLELRRDRELQLGVLIQYEVEMDYVNGLGEPFPVERVQSVVLINSNGDLTTVSGEPAEDDEGLEIGSTSAVWMTANRLRRTGAGLLSKEAVYSVRQVFVDGEDVVQSGKAEYEPARRGSWTLELRLFSLFVDVRSFGFNRAVAGDIGIRKLGEETPFQVRTTLDGLAEFINIPVGDFELTVEDGGWAPAAPLVFTGPKTEILTVMTPWVRALALAVLLLLVVSFLLFVRYDRLRLPILGAWVLMVVLAMNAPAIGTLSGRNLSLDVTPVFDAQGRFVGLDAVVENTSPFVVSQVYCRPDFELRVLEDGGVWTATYESHDFHDVEFGECREHRVRPGVASYRLAPAPGQEWVTLSPDPLPAGEYIAYVRLFDIPAPGIRLELDSPIEPAVEAYVIENPTLGPEVPFASPFED